ncbi:MAG: hypothetical protein LIO78_06860 [Clostridiales bacterium]|nr:hypothetical protein [Clostridiales bacterium]
MFDNPNFLESALSGVALAVGIAALALCPALAPLALPVAAVGAGGLVLGHW